MKDLFAIVMIIIIVVIIVACVDSCTGDEVQLRKCLKGQHNYNKGFPHREIVDGRLVMVKTCACGEREEKPFDECPTCLREY